MTKKEILDSIKDIKKKVKNVAADASAEDVLKLLQSIIDEVNNVAESITDEEIMKMVNSRFLELKPEDVPTIMDYIVKQHSTALSELKNATNGGKVTLPIEVKNKIAKVLATTKGTKTAVKDAVNELLKVENSVTGLTFAGLKDYFIATSWENLNPIWQMLHHTKFTGFFYTQDQLDDATIFAKGWDKNNDGKKVEQEINVTPKDIVPKLVYKLQKLALEDILMLENTVNGQWATFFEQLDKEMYQVLVDSIITTILVGDQVNLDRNKIKSLESIAANPDGTLRTTPDNFTSIVNLVGQDLTYAEVRAGSDMILDPIDNLDMNKSVLFISKEQLTKLSEFRYTADGSLSYKPQEVVAAELGYDQIYVTRALRKLPRVKAIGWIPNQYDIVEIASIDAVFPIYDENKRGYIKEKFIGGARRGLYSSVVYLAPESAQPSSLKSKI